MLYAHTPNEAGAWHTLADHLDAVAQQAAEHAAPFGGATLAEWVGRWHDVGKASGPFQQYLRDCHREPDRRHQTVDHKAAGAALTLQVCPDLAFLIQGHHGGLPDLGVLKEAIKAWGRNQALAETQRRAISADAVPPDMPAELSLPPFVQTAHQREFFLRMLFSALVDADHGDTEHHMRPDRAAQRGDTPDLAELSSRLDANQAELMSHVEEKGRQDDPVNYIRRDVYEACLRAADLPPGFFRLTVPTGGGKTRSSLAFALRHALVHGQRRIVVAVPFLTITEQTVDVYRKVFQEDRAVLEHHSGAGERLQDRDARGGATPQEVWRRLAAQDWDAPVIVTTTVQLFESLFGRSPSACRKLHRLARSVIVLDEAQALPTHLLAPILDGLRELVTNYGTTVLLCTATQPEFAAVPGFAELGDAREIAPEPPRLFRTLERVQYDWQTEPWSWEQAAQEMQSSRQSLAIVNTKKDALALLDALGDDEALHLSTLLCGAHRRDVLAIVRDRLAPGKPCHLVSTQVVEAGVDLDFPLVLRAVGPLDRIVQAAGRCNREGLLPGKGRIVIFEPEEGGLPPGVYRTGRDATKVLLATGDIDPNDPETFARYFGQLFRLLGSSLDRDGIQDLRKRLSYEEVAEKFQMIAEDTVSVVVRYRGMPGVPVADGGTAPELDHVQASSAVIEELRRAAAGRGRLGAVRELFARAQPYVVAVRERDLKEAAAQGLARELIGGFWEWTYERGYDEVRGLIWGPTVEELVV